MKSIKSSLMHALLRDDRRVQLLFSEEIRLARLKKLEEERCNNAKGFVPRTDRYSRMACCAESLSEEIRLAQLKRLEDERCDNAKGLVPRIDKYSRKACVESNASSQ